MKLYDKGEYGHTKILNYIQSDMDKDIPQCKYCQKTDCIACPEALQSDYVNSNVIHRLYYTIFQMAKSYVVSTPNDRSFQHEWTQHTQKFNLLAQGRVNREIRKFIRDMDTLRVYRNKTDYEVSNNHRQDRSLAISTARSAANYFARITQALGSPKC